MKERWTEVKFYWLVRNLYLKYKNLTAIEATLPLINNNEIEHEVEQLTYRILTDPINVPTRVETVHLQLKYGRRPTTDASKITKIHRNTFGNYKDRIKKSDIIYPTCYSDHEHVIMEIYLTKIKEIGDLVL